MGADIEAFSDSVSFSFENIFHSNQVMRETALIENFFVTQFLEKLLTLVQKQSFKFTLVELERQKYVNEFGNNLPICKIRVQSIMINQVKNTINQLIFQVYLLYVFFHEFQTYQPE